MLAVRTAPRLGGRRRIAAAAAAAAVAAAVVLALAVSRPDSRAPVHSQAARPAPARHVGPPGVATLGGKALQSARCAQWGAASTAEKNAVVATLAHVVGGPTPYGPASTLPAAEAHKLFDRACTRSYARGFLLYELYTRAAAFYETPQRNL
jgi:hypothetical protein